jgi:invasion protein IalB
MTVRRTASTTGLLLAVLLGPTAQHAAVAQEASAWAVACDQGADGKRGDCAAVRAVAARGDRSRVIRVAVRRPAGGQPAIMVTVPVRTFLPPGATLRIDGAKLTQTAYQICDEKGCYAGLPADAATVDALKKGRTLSVEFYNAARKKIELRLPLKGFTAAFAKAG